MLGTVVALLPVHVLIYGESFFFFGGRGGGGGNENLNLCGCWYVGKSFIKAKVNSSSIKYGTKHMHCIVAVSWVYFYCIHVLMLVYPGENEEAASEDDEEELDNDEDKDFRVSDYKIKDVEEEEDEIEEEDDEAEGPPKKKRRSYKLHMDADGEERGARPTDQIGDVPIFKTEAEKSQFEQSLNVDLSFVDNMFRQHMIEQDLNDKATVASRMTTNTLNLYSCNMCDKIFKTLSHMRLHCLTHTDAKPFKCPKCPYRSNGKGIYLPVYIEAYFCFTFGCTIPVL